MIAHEKRVEEILIKRNRALRDYRYPHPDPVIELALAQLRYIVVLEAAAEFSGREVPKLVSARMTVAEAMQRI